MVCLAVEPGNGKSFDNLLLWISGVGVARKSEYVIFDDGETLGVRGCRITYWAQR